MTKPLPWEPGYNHNPGPIVESRLTRVRAYLGQPTSMRVIGYGLGFIVLLMIILGIWFVFFNTKEVGASIGQMRWERQIEIEQYRTIEARDWRGSEPNDARIYDERSEIHHYDRRLSHYNTVSYSCGTMDNPRTCTREEPVYVSVPVYRTRLYYKVDRWVTDSWVVAKGTEIHPHWPALPAALDDTDILGNKREGDARKQHYEMDVICDCDPSTIELNHKSWADYRPGQKVIAYVTVTGRVRGVSIIQEDT